jgi:hypothetical protein
MPDRPVFLERQTYRMRRMMDAVRLLPILGLALWMVPLMWPLQQGDESGAKDGLAMSTALLYVFGVWASLALMGWVLWLKTRSTETSQNTPPEDVPD